MVDETTGAAGLIEAGRDIGRFSLCLDDRQDVPRLVCEAPVRLIPGRRLVCRASWQGRPVFAKLFLDGAKYWQREIDGLDALHAAGIAAPELLFAGTADTGNIRVILLEEIAPAESLLQAWMAADDDAARAAVAEQLLETVASHHAAGLQQADIHLDNFLRQGNRVITLDGGGIKQSGEVPLPLQAALDNLGLLLAQFYPVHDDLLQSVLPAYEAARRWEPGALPVPLLLRRVSRYREQRLQRFMTKVFRDCSAIACERHFSRFVAFDRALDSPELRKLLSDPDASLSAPGARLLKQGNTCTLWQTSVSGQSLVIKRYNMKSRWHRLGRALRRSRAAVSWENAHRLAMLGIATPAPVALVEERIGPLRGRAWYIAACEPGGNATTLCEAGGLTPERKAAAAGMAQLLRQLQQSRISHGDMKATNFILSPRGPVLIDLDAMRAHRCNHCFRRRLRRDWRRFMRNWLNCPELGRYFREVMKIR